MRINKPNAVDMALIAEHLPTPVFKLNEPMPLNNCELFYIYTDDEYGNEVQYTLAINRISEFRTDVYAIQLTRANALKTVEFLDQLEQER